MTSVRLVFAYGVAGLVALSLSAVHVEAAGPQQPTQAASAQAGSAETAELVDQYCIRCHNADRTSGGLALDACARTLGSRVADGMAGGVTEASPMARSKE